MATEKGRDPMTLSRITAGLLACGLAFSFTANAQQLNSTGEWTDWQTNGAYSGIDVRARCQHGGPFDAQYFLQFRNRYPESVRLLWALTSSGPTTGGPFQVNL